MPLARQPRSAASSVRRESDRCSDPKSRQRLPERRRGASIPNKQPADFENIPNACLPNARVASVSMSRGSLRMSVTPSAQ